MDPTLINESTVEVITEHHLGTKPKKITKLGGGLSNFVFEAEMENGDLYIVRLSDVPTKLNYFIKEQWAVAQARERGVPAPEILEVGNEIVPTPYMIVRKVNGQDAGMHPERMKIIRDMGKYAAIINTIPTSGFGHVFDWSNNTLSKRETWREFLEKDLNVPERLEILQTHELLSKENFEKLARHLKEMEAVDKSPTLNHSDMRLKNVLVDESGKIVAILDWENCMSSLAPFWEISIALHDLTIDEKQTFLEGYGLREKDYMKIADGVKALNIINYAPHAAFMAERKDVKGLEKFKVRLNGYLDLYCL